MHRILSLAIAVSVVLGGCTMAPRQQQTITQEDKGQAPVILGSYAAGRIRPGATWRIYLRAHDQDGDMNVIASSLYQPGVGFYPVDFTRLKGENRKEFAGYLFLTTPLDLNPILDTFTLKIVVRDSKGNRSEPIDLPLAIDYVPQQPPPEEWKIAADNRLGAILIRIQSSERYNNDGRGLIMR